jgi:hypothetical protein
LVLTYAELIVLRDLSAEHVVRLPIVRDETVKSTDCIEQHAVERNFQERLMLVLPMEVNQEVSKLPNQLEWCW